MPESDVLGIFIIGDQLLQFAPHNVLLTLMSGGAIITRQTKYSDKIPGGVVLPDGLFLTSLVTKEYGVVSYPDAYTAMLKNKGDGIDITAPAGTNIKVVALRWKRTIYYGGFRGPFGLASSDKTIIHRTDTYTINAGKTQKVYEGAGHTEHYDRNTRVVDDYYTTVVLTRVV